MTSGNEYSTSQAYGAVPPDYHRQSPGYDLATDDTELPAIDLGLVAAHDDPDDSEPALTAAEDAPYPVSPQWRARLFLAGLILSALVALCGGLSAVWTPEYAERVVASGGAVLAALGIITNGLGIAYRRVPGVLR